MSFLFYPYVLCGVELTCEQKVRFILLSVSSELHILLLDKQKMLRGFYSSWRKLLGFFPVLILSLAKMGTTETEIRSHRQRFHAALFLNSKHKGCSGFTD